MKTFLSLFATLAVMSLGAGPLLAGTAILPLKVSFKLTVQAQGLENQQVGNSPVYKSTILSVKVLTKDIIDVIGVAYGTTFVNVSLIVDDNSGDFFLIDQNGTVLHNVTADGFLNNFFDTESDLLSKGQFNNNTRVQDTTDVFANEFDFEDESHNNSFSIFGLESFHFTVDVNRKFTGSFTLSGGGAGRLETPPDGGPGVPLVLFNGTISGKGSGTIQPVN
jgi:hypothetical protein